MLVKRGTVQVRCKEELEKVNDTKAGGDGGVRLSGPPMQWRASGPRGCPRYAERSLPVQRGLGRFWGSSRYEAPVTVEAEASSRAGAAR